MQFAWDLLNYEMELELYETVSLHTIQKLTALYVQGMESYESNGDQRYIYFQKKMNQLLMRPNVVELMDKQVEKKNSKQQITEIQSNSGETVQKQDQNNRQVDQKYQNEEEDIQKIQEKKQKELFKAQKEQIIKKKVYEQQVCNEDQVKLMVLTKKQEKQNVENLIKNDLDSQLLTIQQRLKQRKNRCFSVQENLKSEGNMKDFEDLDIQPLNEIEEGEDELVQLCEIDQIQTKEASEQKNKQNNTNFSNEKPIQSSPQRKKDIYRDIQSSSPAKYNRRSKRGQNLSMDVSTFLNSNKTLSQFLQNINLQQNSNLQNYLQQKSNPFKISQQHGSSKKRTRSLDNQTKLNSQHNTASKINMPSRESLINDQHKIVQLFNTIGFQQNEEQNQ